MLLLCLCHGDLLYMILTISTFLDFYHKLLNFEMDSVILLIRDKCKPDPPLATSAASYAVPRAVTCYEASVIEATKGEASTVLICRVNHHKQGVSGQRHRVVWRYHTQQLREATGQASPVGCESMETRASLCGPRA
jgi:hypothetical protein